jgi:hypothetical protein
VSAIEIVVIMELVTGLKTTTSVLSQDTKAEEPSDKIVIEMGWPVREIFVTDKEERSITETLLPALLHTQAFVPSGVIAIAVGGLPTVTVCVPPVAISIMLTVSADVLHTQSVD